MKLKEILFVTGQPGLFQFIAQGRGGVIVESLLDHKRTMLGASAKVSGLGDIAMYTDNEEKPLSEILQSLYDKNKGPLSLTKDSSVEELRAFMAEAVPGYDQDRVHNSDIKKLVTWYNLLVNSGMTDFKVEDEADDNISEKKEDIQKKNQAASAKPAPKATSQSKAKTPKSTTSRKSQ